MKQTWISDDNGNKCSVEYFGSEEAARKALESLGGCENCVNCAYCVDCTRCTDCLRCGYCFDCSLCTNCVNLMDCSGEKRDAPPIPAIPEIHNRVYAAVTERPDALDISDWHTCKTTHCRAGWVVVLAGKEGRALEKFFGTELAAIMIYRESGYRINAARFHDGNEDALADMKRLAEQEVLA